MLFRKRLSQLELLLVSSGAEGRCAETCLLRACVVASELEA